NFVAVKGTYWDLAGAVVKELTATDVREIEPAHHKWQAFTLTMRNTQSGHSTEIVWSKLAVGVGIADDVFTERTIEKKSYAAGGGRIPPDCRLSRGASSR